MRAHTHTHTHTHTLHTHTHTLHIHTRIHTHTHTYTHIHTPTGKKVFIAGVADDQVGPPSLTTSYDRKRGSKFCRVTQTRRECKSSQAF